MHYQFVECRPHVGINQPQRAGVSDDKADKTARIVSPSNGNRPVERRYNTQPRLNRSEPATDRLAAGLLRGHVRRRAHDRTGLGDLHVVALGPSQPEVQDLDPPGGASSQMLAGLMSRWIRPFRWAAASPAAISRPIRSTRSTDGLRPRFSQLLQRIAQEVFHGEEQDIVVTADLIDRDDVVVFDGGGA